MTRPDGRAPHELRPITFQRDFTEMASGSVLVSFGRTRVLCTASVDEDVPRWMKGSGKGWVTAEYSMLPGSSPERVDREAAKGKQSSRTVEIQRLIGRSLRSACDMKVLGERQQALPVETEGDAQHRRQKAERQAGHDPVAHARQCGRTGSRKISASVRSISSAVR